MVNALNNPYLITCQGHTKSLANCQGHTKSCQGHRVALAEWYFLVDTAILFEKVKICGTLNKYSVPMSLAYNNLCKIVRIIFHYRRILSGTDLYPEYCQCQ